VAGLGLMLAFGSYDDGPQHQPKSLALAREIVETLNRHGVPATWDGTIGRRIEILPFEWRRRRSL
jgi:hypothetical protein